MPYKHDKYPDKATHLREVISTKEYYRYLSQNFSQKDTGIICDSEASSPLHNQCMLLCGFSRITCPSVPRRPVWACRKKKTKKQSLHGCLVLDWQLINLANSRAVARYGIAIGKLRGLSIRDLFWGSQCPTETKLGKKKHKWISEYVAYQVYWF